MTRTLRVLTLVDAYRFGGAEILLAQLAAACPDVDIDMSIVSLSPPSMNAPETMAALRDAGVKARNLHIRRLLDPTAIPQLVREIRQSGCDIVHAHLEMAITLALPAAKLTRTPLVCTFHHVASPQTGRAAKRERLAVKAATRSDKAIFVSEASRSAFQHEHGFAAAPPNWDVVHNGVDLTNFTPGPADPNVREELGGTEAPLVVIPGAFRAVKGIPVGIEAWKTVRKNHPDALLSIVGDGELAGEYRRQVAEAGLDGAVIFAGSRTDMPNVYRAADIVVAPALHGENFPTVLIEASATGRPIVTTTAGGIPDIVADRETGLLAEAGDPAELAEAICELLRDAELASKLGAAATLRARQEFSATAWASNLRKLYESAIRSDDE
ncbi:glycosyltransferase family 4 protein [Rhodococcus sp. MS16]|uniref:glycosyltransferase family 4 protein n=1 Tax=Rhodococcus sp. MS16 TaxID=2579941 RepID=UPI001561B378|nr:glycosyltransferase family 4 protein [Rhodococcus sp. MS16]NRI66963.1 glycosyltransferase family 4 protein [Rhodococcus sp. MS16]